MHKNAFIPIYKIYFSHFPLLSLFFFRLIIFAVLFYNTQSSMNIDLAKTKKKVPNFGVFYFFKHFHQFFRDIFNEMFSKIFLF